MEAEKRSEKKDRWYRAFANKQFWAYFGPALIVSVAYMDPGNFGTSIAAGSSFGYALLWVVWLSSGMAMLFQYLSGKMGIAGYSLAEMIKLRWKDKRYVMLYWLLAEFSIIATDLAEFLGIAVALNLLFGIPLIIAAFISVLDVLLLLLLTKKNFRTLEYAFIVFVSIIGIGFVYELFITRPALISILYGSIVPILNQNMILFVVGIIGATVMPHALFVHSWLTKNKMQDKKHDKDKAMQFHKADTIASLLVAGLINAAILIMAAGAFYATGHLQVATINEAYKILVPLFGAAAGVVFAVTLLFSGISSSITGTLAGQSIMESLTEFRISPTVRRLITRFINLVPIVIAIMLNIQPLEILVYSQVILSFLIPLPLIPLVYYTSKRDVMGKLVNSRLTIAVASAFTVLIVVLNAYLIFTLF